jgi:cation diffusion facilitator family transporter
MSGLEKILNASSVPLETPGVLALIAALVSIGIKEWMFWYTRAAAKKIESGALLADAWHHRSDALSSVGSFICIAGARLGFPILDPIASVIICVIIIKVALDIAVDSISKLTDNSVDDETVSAIQSVISSCDGVQTIDELRTESLPPSFMWMLKSPQTAGFR